MVGVVLTRYDSWIEWVMPAPGDCLAVGTEYGVLEEELRSSGSVEKVGE